MTRAWWRRTPRIAPPEPQGCDLADSEAVSEPECQPTPTEPESTWVPGDPLHPRSQAPHSQYLFNFRDDPTSDECSCADAADWPAQERRALPDRDELGEFIAAYHADADTRETA